MLLPDSQVISFVLQTFQKMSDIHGAGPSTLIHFEERRRPFDFQYLPAERQAEVTLVFECVCVTACLLCQSNTVSPYLSVQDVGLNMDQGAFFSQSLLFLENDNKLCSPEQFDL